MRILSHLDYWVMGVYLLAVFVLGMVLTRRASRSVDDFFVGGRHLPWWLLGVSMAATNFSIDTPIAITKMVAKNGIAGVWFFWASAISAVLVTFLFARLWRRSRVLTDAEIIELRYAGKSAAGLRLFKGVYFGLLFNVFIMGWVFVALRKVLAGATDLDTNMALISSTVVVFVYTVSSGFYGVVWTDFFQYFVALCGAIALAAFSVAEVGGLGALVDSFAQSPETLDFFPKGGGEPLAMFLVFALVQWWAHKYSDGGGKHIQRMLSARTESHASAASLFYAAVNFALQIWPWILTALCAMALFGTAGDPELLYPRIMVRVLPAGVLGLVLACLMGAFMSTIDTHLNLGASYFINDIYRRFLVKGRTDAHYVLVSRLSMALLLGSALLLSLHMESVEGAWKFLLTFASGAGLTWIVRWFWWRANAWTEISGMVASGVIATSLSLVLPDMPYHQKLLVTVGITTVVWVAVTYLTSPVPSDHLASFVRRVAPGSPGWNRICREHGIEQRPFLARGLLSWLLGLGALFGLNFAIGSVLLGRLWAAALFGTICLASGIPLWRIAWGQPDAGDLQNRG
jgi:SSS family transporter